MNFTLNKLHQLRASGVKNSDIIVPSTRFSTEKMLMFAKLSLKGFIYDLCETN